MQSEPAFARQAVQSGAKGYVLKEAADAEFVQAVHAAAEGRTYLNPDLGARMAAAPTDPAGAEIGAQLYLSVRTIESHRAHIQQKTCRTSRSELVRYAFEHSLLEEGP